MKRSTPFPTFGRQQRRTNPDGNSEYYYEAAIKSPRPHVDTNEYFCNEFECLYKKVTTFVDKFFREANSATATKNSTIWLRDLSPEFLNYTEMVVHADEFSGGWDRILSEPKQRHYLLVGIFACILESKIFGELLFGASERQRICLEKNEMVLFLEHEEGFKRTAERAEKIKDLIGGSEGPINRASAIDQLCKQIEMLFRPLRGHLEDGSSERVAPFLPLEDLFQDLREIVAAAADLSVKIRLSNTIFYFSSELPGNTFNREFQENIDQPACLASKAAVTASFEWKCKVDREEPVAAKYRPLVKFAVWPSIRRYSPGNGKAGGTNDGYTIYEVCKSRVVYYWEPKLPSQQQEHCLREFINQQRRDNVIGVKIFAGFWGQNRQNVKSRASEIRNWKVLVGLAIVIIIVSVITTGTKGILETNNIIWRVGNGASSMAVENIELLISKH